MTEMRDEDFGENEVRKLINYIIIGYDSVNFFLNEVFATRTRF